MAKKITLSLNVTPRTFELVETSEKGLKKYHNHSPEKTFSILGWDYGDVLKAAAQIPISWEFAYNKSKTERLGGVDYQGYYYNGKDTLWAKDVPAAQKDFLVQALSDNGKKAGKGVKHSREFKTERELAERLAEIIS